MRRGGTDVRGKQAVAAGGHSWIPAQRCLPARRCLPACPFLILLRPVRSKQSSFFLNPTASTAAAKQKSLDKLLAESLSEQLREVVLFDLYSLSPFPLLSIIQMEQDNFVDIEINELSPLDL